jgi:transposase
VAIGGLGGIVDEPEFIAANTDGYAQLLAWAVALGDVHVFAVEGCGSYGVGLARFLRRHGHPPVDVPRPPRAGERRMSGKSDAIDAEHAARTALANKGVVIPKLADGQVEAIRLVKIARDTAVKAHTTATITLKAVLVTADQDLRDRLEPLITAGDNAGRVRNEAAFAKMCGVATIPTGSGKTSGRHRLNRGGNRQANAALYRAVIVRMRWHAPTIAYVEKRTADGLSKKDIIRCLKRYLARELFQLLPETSSSTAAPPLASAA